MASYSSTMDKWARTNKARMLAIWQESTQRISSRSQARIPVDLGFARASIRASLEIMPKINRNFGNKDGKTVSWNSAEITLTIASARLGQTIYIGWTANYVLPLEYGHSKQAPSGFIRVTAMEWPQTVRQVTAEARARVRSG